MRRAIAILPLFVILAACTDRRRPPYASQDEGNPARPDVDAAPTFAPLPTGTDAPCETVIELPIVKPNFYFVLDASGSMQERMPGSTQSRYRTAVAAISDMLEGVQTRVNFGAAVFPNTFAGASCQAGNEVFPLADGSKPNNDTTALTALNRKLRGYSPEGGSPVSPTLGALYPTLREFDGDTYVFLFSDGAPNCNLSRGCEARECILNLEGATFSDGSACDDSFNCCAPDLFPHLCLDRDPTLAQLTRLAEHDVSTYIIGMPGGAAYASLLNEMAVAAGTARTQNPAPDPANETSAPNGGGASADSGFASGLDSGANFDGGAAAPALNEPAQAPDDGLLYYQISDAQSLAWALATLTREILIDCTLQLDFAPSKPEFLQVTAGANVLTEDQWQLSSDTQIELLGDACADWKAGELEQVRVQQTCRGPAR